MVHLIMPVICVTGTHSGICCDSLPGARAICACAVRPAFVLCDSCCLLFYFFVLYALIFDVLVRRCLFCCFLDCLRLCLYRDTSWERTWLRFSALVDETCRHSDIFFFHCLFPIWLCVTTCLQTQSTFMSTHTNQQ